SGATTHLRSTDPGSSIYLFSGCGLFLLLRLRAPPASVFARASGHRASPRPALAPRALITNAQMGGMDNAKRCPCAAVQSRGREHAAPTYRVRTRRIDCNARRTPPGLAPGARTREAHTGWHGNAQRCPCVRPAALTTSDAGFFPISC